MPSAESPAKSEPALDVRGLERRFRVGVFLRRRAALRGIDLSLARGSWLGLVGPNGSGKTSLLRILAGVDVASAGEVRVLGGDPSRRQTRARVAFLPEDSPFPPELSARAALDLLGVFSKIFDTTFLQEPNIEFCNKYLASSQVKDFIKIFESL
jgi:ABC-2 type transport system ATP-binding protein